MTTKFESIEFAKAYATRLAGIDPKTAVFTEDPKLKVEDMSCMLLSEPDVSDEMKQEIRARLDAQKGFRFKNKNGVEVSIVIGPFRDGFDLWFLGPNGFAQRV